MVTRSRSVKHTRRRHRRHAKTNKRLSKRYRGRKGYNKRITRRHTQRSHDTDIINTQGGGNLTIWSAAKTAAGKALELKIISRYLLRNINKIITHYVDSKGITLEEFYRLIAQPPYYNELPLKVKNALQLQNEFTHMSNTAAHDLPHEILSRYNELFPEDDEYKDKDVSLITTDTEELVYDENGDEVVTHMKGRDRDTNDKLDILTGIRAGNVSIKAKKIEYRDNPTSASIDSGDAVTFLGHIFNPSGVPFIMIVVFYTQSDYLLPQLQEEHIKMLSASGVTTTGKPRRGNFIFVRKIVKINMTDASHRLCGRLTQKQKEDILSDLTLASEYVKSHDEKTRDEGTRICKEVDDILTEAHAFLRVSTKDNIGKCTKNRIQARVTLDLHALKSFCEVDDNPVVSPIGSMVSTPTISTAKKARGVSFGDVQRQSLRRDAKTTFFRLFKPGSFENKTDEETGKIVMETLLKSSNPNQYLKRIYNEEQSQGASRKGASRTPSASAGRKPRVSASGRTPSASAGRKPRVSASGRTPSASLRSQPGAISRASASTGLRTIPESSIYDDRIFPPSRSSTRGPIFSTPNLGVTESTDMEELD
jgi:hypothetical protein